MRDILAQIETLIESPPQDPAERLALYNAAKKLLVAVEDPFETIHRVNGSPMILTFSWVASNLGIFEKLAKSNTPLRGASIAASAKADPELTSRILRFLASHDLIAETAEDTFTANPVSHSLARPGFRSGLSHSFNVLNPCLQATPKFLEDTGYANPTDVLHSPFQIAFQTDKPAFGWAVEHPEIMANFQTWMREWHDNTKATWLDVFDFAAHAKGSTPETLLFVDVAGGHGQQCALLKMVHPQIPGRFVLEDLPSVVPHAKVVNGVEKLGFDLWAEQPLKGARIYYIRNILHDYPDDKAIAIIKNILPAMSPDSLLIIDDGIIPKVGATATATHIDMTMMSALAATERTERQWDALLDKSGMKIIQKSTFEPSRAQSIIVAVPK
ncbi:S-adenosyl-L-methionine-dependent methyltransferase [Podospora didyma]|uniref:S-adenosyl-L-methionine-dependent methyltransferase n=1 Tax=Podospora didyma TaxID=330526 RepID=A0AAE0NZZ6_9PEZI|nr:S-adenosyl-L-methionine-dependent methyltransferase [Podospora didyma]